jgi:arabinose-5-phosphate isomerase
MNQPQADQQSVEEIARNVLSREAEAVARLARNLPAGFSRAVELILACKGRVIVTGMGKMSAIARKFSATLCSTGTPATFMHPAEAHHGDLGMVTANELLVALSNSGETEEVISLVPLVRRHNVPVIAITGSNRGSLAQIADCAVVLDTREEADPVSDAPTVSTIAALAICDAIAIALVHRRGFTREQFALFHPGGALGRRMLLRTGDLMHSGDRLPVLDPDQTLREAIVVISQKGLGAGLVHDSQFRLQGILTDGDLRRLLGRHDNPLAMPVREVMSRTPVSVRGSGLAVEALNLMRERSISVLPVTDDSGRITGIIHVHDLLRAGLG